MEAEKTEEEEEEEEAKEPSEPLERQKHSLQLCNMGTHTQYQPPSTAITSAIPLHPHSPNPTLHGLRCLMHYSEQNLLFSLAFFFFLTLTCCVQQEHIVLL